ncbi:hypothetical protein D3C78_237430 [compost metagenome]
MSVEITEELLDSILRQITESPKKLAACDLIGDLETNLLALRELRRRGLIDGEFEERFTGPGDGRGRYLDNAAHLELA